MCLTLPVRVVAFRGSIATIEVGGRRREASAAAVPGIREGDWAILAAGILVRVLDPEMATELVSAFRLANDQIGGQS